MVTLLIVASTLGRDGTSRFITYLANNLTKSNKVRVKLLFFRNISEDSKSMLDDDVEVSCLEVQGKLWSSFYKILNNVLNSKADFCLFGSTIIMVKSNKFCFSFIWNKDITQRYNNPVIISCQ